MCLACNLLTTAGCNDDLDFMEQINQELEVDTLSLQEGVIKRSAINHFKVLFLSLLHFTHCILF